MFCTECGFTIEPAGRRKLGYRTCLECGSPAFKPPVIPMSKSNYVVGTMADLQESYGAKGPRL
jgi:hypothetical protein